MQMLDSVSDELLRSVDVAFDKSFYRKVGRNAYGTKHVNRAFSKLRIHYDVTLLSVNY